MLANENNNKFFYFSLLLHLIVLVAVICSFEFASQTAVLENSNKNSQVINAMVMDAQPLPHPVTQQQPLPPKPILAKPKIEPKKITPPPPPKPIIQKPQPLPVVKKQAIAILDKKVKKLQQEKLEQQLLSDLQQQTHQQLQKKIKQKHKQKALESAFAQEMRELNAKSLQQQMLQEQKRIAGARTQALRGIVDKYKALILQAISQHWLLPSTIDKNLTAELLIRLAPGGVVLDVQVMKSSGDQGLDRSAQAAVFKASPLPVPHSLDEFEPFRQFVLKVKPENILGGDSLQG